MFDLIIKNGTCVTPDGRKRIDVAVRGGKIVELGSFENQEAKETFDATNLHVLPGLMDTHVHFREPGDEKKEDLHTGSKAAIAGGITAVFEMPNTKPPTTTPKALQDKLDRAAGKCWCDYAFFAGATPDNAKELAQMERMEGCCGIKIFMGCSTGSLLVADDDGIREILKHGFRRVAVHCEDEDLLNARKKFIREGDVSSHPDWRNEEVAFQATSRLLNLARETGRPVHVLHVNTAEEIDLLAEYKDVATAEVTPQHLTFYAPDCYARLGTYVQMFPSIKAKRHQEGLWKGIREDIIDTIGSDHAPHLRSEKEQTYPRSPAGIPGVQTTVPLMLNSVNEGRLTLERLIDLMAYGPQHVYQIANKGRLEQGYDADFTIVDLKEKRTIKNEMMHSKCGWTPYDGMEVTGWPKATIIRGNIVMKDDKILGEPLGRAIRFRETLKS